MTTPRSKILKHYLEYTVHCISRCVRRARLCGKDPHSKQNFNHRKVWIKNRIQELAGIFLIDVCGYAVMSNHLHLVLRNRPDLVADCSDKEIACRWLQLFPKSRMPDGSPAQPTDDDISAIVNNPSRLQELRERLSSISWFMRCLKEPIARQANLEDECTGRFWEGRFKSIVLLDQAAIATCAAYVDLNPIRAGLAETPEESDFTSIQERIAARRQEHEGSSITQTNDSEVNTPQRNNRDSWLCPISDEGERRGFLNMDLDAYLELVDWTGRQITHGKKGAIPDELAPILTRLKINGGYWHESSTKFGKMFYRAAGARAHMDEAARSAGQQWMRQAPSAWGAFMAS